MYDNESNPNGIQRVHRNRIKQPLILPFALSASNVPTITYLAQYHILIELVFKHKEFYINA